MKNTNTLLKYQNEISLNFHLSPFENYCESERMKVHSNGVGRGGGGSGGELGILNSSSLFRIALDNNIQTRKLKKIIAWRNT